MGFQTERVLMNSFQLDKQIETVSLTELNLATERLYQRGQPKDAVIQMEHCSIDRLELPSTSFPMLLLAVMEKQRHEKRG
jgi:hypothetical protein